MKLKRIACGLLCMTGLLAEVVQAQGYPNRPVKLLVATAPGGSPDVVGRLLAEKLAQSLGQSFIVENRPGGGGTVGSSQVARSAADGYTLLVVEMGQLVIGPQLQTEVSYNPVRDFTPIAMAATTPLYFASGGKTGIKTLNDLITQAKAKPGVLNYGSSGIGSLHHLAMEVFKARTGVDIVHVPFKGAGVSTPALLAGDVEIVLAGLPTVSAFVQGGRVNLLAVTSAQRSSDAPNVPAISETIKDYDFSAEIGILGPAGLSRDVVTRLSGAIRSALDAPEVRAKLKVIGAAPTWSSPDDYAENIRVKYKQLGDAAKASGIQAN
jgi:tripartite-type tricarboxylate transporter receptor subunit TctC